MPSMPLLPGMTMSIRTTSGLCSSASNTARSAFGRLADRLDVLLGVEHAPEARADDGVVVDDENADGHGSGTSATSVVPVPGAGLDPQAAADERHALAHPDEPEPFVAGGGGVEAAAVVLDDRSDASRPCRVSRMLTRPRRRA